MKYFLAKFFLLSLGVIVSVTYAQSNASFTKGPLPSKSFIKDLVGSYKIIKTGTNGECPLDVNDEFIISYTSDDYYQASSVGVFVIEANTKDNFYLGKEHLPQNNPDQRLWTGVQNIVHENSSILRQHKTVYDDLTHTWLRTVLSFDFSHTPGTYLEIRQNSSVCSSFQNNLPVWNGGSSQRLPDSCTFVEDENPLIPASFYCLAVKLNLDSLHAAE